MKRISWPPKQFREEVDIEAKNLVGLAEPLFSSSDAENSRIWAYLLLHLKQAAHCIVSKLWADNIIHSAIRPVSFVVAAVILPYTGTPPDPKADNIPPDLYLVGYLLASYVAILLLSSLLHWSLYLWDRPYGPAVHPPRPVIALTLCFVIAFVPQLLLQVALYRHYHVSPFISLFIKWLVPQLLTLGTSVALIEILCVIGHASLFSFLNQQIERRHLSSQLPWALASALAQIIKGRPNTGAYYNWQTKDIELKQFVDDADRIHTGLQSAGNLAHPDQISRCVKETLKRLDLWMYPLFIPRAYKILGRIQLSTGAIDVVHHPVYKPISIDIYRKLDAVRLKLEQLRKELPTAIQTHLFAWRQYKPTAIKNLKTILEYENALKAVIPDLKNPEFQELRTNLRLDNPGGRGHILYHLETAAKTIGSIPIILPKGTQAETHWMNQVYSERAEAVRELKTWVALPLDCTRPDLEDKLRTILTTIADGNWGALEQRPVPTTPETPLWKRTLRIAQKLVVAVAPLALFQIADHFFHENIDPGIRNLVIAWTGLSVLALFDPGFAAKLSSFKDVKESIPGPEKKH
jgi:hypothetical protein